MPFTRRTCSVILAFTAFCSVAAAAEFDVSFGTRKPLGLNLDAQLRVIGFTRARADTLPPAEANGWIKTGDRLVAVNEERVSHLPLNDVVRKIVKADLPKILRFSAKNNEDRVQEMTRYRANEGNFDGFTGNVEVFTDGVPSGKFPFVQALFGRNVSCALAKLVVADPPDACAGLNNAAAARDSVVLVQRGNCPFASKALNVQAADGYGIIIANDRQGSLFRMPQSASDTDGASVNIPSVLVAELDGLALTRALKTHHHSPILVRLAPDFPRCDAPARKAQKVDTAPAPDAPLPQVENPSAHMGGLPADAQQDTQILANLQKLLDPNVWPANEAARRKLYFRLSKLHHPDVPGGSKQRFEVLSAAYEAANQVYGGGGAGAGVEAADVAAAFGGRSMEL